MYASNPVSLADIAAVTDRNNNDGFGNNGWWVIIILLALFGGFGNGWSGNGGNGSVGAEIQRGFDTNGIMNSLRGIEQGICSLGYDQLGQMNGLNMNIMTGFNNLQRSQDNCCCQNQLGQKDLLYTMAKDTCDITQAINQAAERIVQNDNNNYRQLHDEQIALQMEGLKTQLREKDQLIVALNQSISQTNQSNDIVDRVINRLNTCPVGTYNVANPNSCNNGGVVIPQALAYQLLFGGNRNCDCNNGFNGFYGYNFG